VDFENQIVRIAPDLVHASLKTAPRYYTMGARSPAHDIDLAKGGLYCGNGWMRRGNH